METQAQVLYPDGRVENVHPEKGRKFTLKELQTIVGGVIDIQRLRPQTRYMVLNDNGKLEGLEMNPLASKLWQEAYPIEHYPYNNDGIIVGTVVICNRAVIQ